MYSNSNRNSDYEQIGEGHHQIIQSPGQSDGELKIFGYTQGTWRQILFHCLGILFLGAPYAIVSWFPILATFRFKKCSLSTATLIYIRDHAGNDSINDVFTDNIDVPGVEVTLFRHFKYQHNEYVWVSSKHCFGTLQDFMPKITLRGLVTDSHGLDPAEELKVFEIYGPNKIEVEVKSYWRLFVEEVFNPFYIFQAFSVILWFCDNYMIYAGCVVVLTAFSIITTLLEIRKQSEALHSLVESSSHSGHVHVLRKEVVMKAELVKLTPSCLVPGQIIIIPRTGFVMPCDAVLLTGNVIVNESMLTGESVPVLKTPPNESSEIYDTSKHKAHTLFSGTQIIQGRYYGDEHIKARVVQTGFNTIKGSLVKSIMFPSPVGFKFYLDSMKFVACLFVVASVGMGYCIYLYIQRDAEVREIIIRTLDIITIVVPPAMPAAMSVGISYSRHRLKKKQIFCISPPRINISGKTKLACFDKTGTLTHEGLDLYSVLPCERQKFTEQTEDVELLDKRSPLVQAMATCHTLTRIDGSINGDPLDLKIFSCTNWILEEPGSEETNFDILAPTVVRPASRINSTLSRNSTFQDGSLNEPMNMVHYEIGIIRQFQFSSNLQRMSVICRILGEQSMLIYTKGAPEKIESMCLQDTIPPDFHSKLAEYTVQGFRVIAFAYKKLSSKFKWKDAQKVNRELVECQLNFLGFVIMQNTLKEETTPVISTLQAANIRTVMITGDNVMTGICVARECGMIDVNDEVLLLHLKHVNNNTLPRLCAESIGSTNAFHGDAIINLSDDSYCFAIVGDTWVQLLQHYTELLPKILLKTTVFARFQPDHKTQLIKHFQTLDYIVAMVGDGANDCGALKAAHVGVSLSQAEASVAAPFTSSVENISCLVHLILEGRCALVTSFAVFKYMALYSLIQFFTIILLYKQNSILGDQQFLFIDLIITTSLAVTIGRQGPSNIMVPKRPMGSLLSGSNLVPMCLQILLCAFIQYGAMCYLKLQEWFIPNPTEKDEIVLCWENTVLFTVSSFQYVILALVYSKGKPYREHLITNLWLLVCSLALICFITYMCICPSKEVAEFFELMYLPPNYEMQQHLFRDSLMLFPISHYIISVAIEYFLSESIWLKKVLHFILRKKKPKNRYKLLALEKYEFSFDSSI